MRDSRTDETERDRTLARIRSRLTTTKKACGHGYSPLMSSMLNEPLLRYFTSTKCKRWLRGSCTTKSGMLRMRSFTGPLVLRVSCAMPGMLRSMP